MSQKVVLTELNLYEEMVPLAAGYLEAFARTDPTVDAGTSFATCAKHVDIDENQLYEG